MGLAKIKGQGNAKPAATAKIPAAPPLDTSTYKSKLSLVTPRGERIGLGDSISAGTKSGTCVYIGETAFSAGEWIGMELLTPGTRSCLLEQLAHAVAAQMARMMAVWMVFVTSLAPPTTVSL